MSAEGILTLATATRLAKTSPAENANDPEE
jgi:hypothetical protein